MIKDHYPLLSHEIVKLRQQIQQDAEVGYALVRCGEVIQYNITLRAIETGKAMVAWGETIRISHPRENPFFPLLRRVLSILSLCMIVSACHPITPPCVCSRNLLYCMDNYPPGQTKLDKRQWSGLCQEDLHQVRTQFQLNERCYENLFQNRSHGLFRLSVRSIAKG